MANIRNANTYYIDGTASNLALKSVKVTHVIISASSATAILVLKDVTSGNIKFDGRVATSGESRTFDLSDNPIVFPNGIDPTTVTNCVATLVIMAPGG